MHPYNPVPNDVRELDESFADYLRLRNDAAVVDCHPTAAEMVRWETSLEDIVRRVARLGYGERIQSRHLTASDFGSSLSVAMARVVGVDYTAAADEVSAVVKNVTAHGVRPVETPTLMLGDIVQADFARLLPLATVATGDSVDVSLYAARFLIGRALILNDEAGAVATAASQLGGMAARLEAEAVATVLNSPTTAMSDGTARFVSGTNETVATGLDVSSANEALGLLRQQTFTGPNGFESGYVNAAAKTLLVPPSSLATAWTLNVAFGQPLRIVSNAWLDGSAAFLFADPQVAPALIRARPRAYQTPGIVQTAAVDNLPDGTEQQFDGLAMRFEHAFGIGMASRLGVVRIPLS